MGRVERMADLVGWAVRDGVAVLNIDNPPVNALSRALSGALIAALERAEADSSVTGVVIRAEGRTWPAGADIKEFGVAGPSRLPDLTARIAACPKPVVALLHGTALGGGLELALAATARLAVAGTRLGLPEVALGLLPGAGGTQRLPRLIGPEAALSLMLSGKPVTAEDAVRIGLIDGVADPAEVLDLALALARDLAAGGSARAAPPAADARVWMAAVARARAGLAAAGPELPAPARIVDCVEAALLLPEAAGFEAERAAFEDLLATPESAALRHVFLAERRAAHPRALMGAKPAEPQRIAVTGPLSSGTGGLAAVIADALSAGIAVAVSGADEPGLAALFAAVAEAQETAVADGRLTRDDLERDWARLSGTVGPARVADADLVLRADPGGPLPLGIAAADLWVAEPSPGQAGLTLRSGLRLAEIGIHPGAPPPGVTLAAVLGFVRRLGRVPVVSARPVLQALARALARAADHLVEAGASPYAVDRALESWGFASGPYALRGAGGPLPLLLAPSADSLMAMVMVELGGRPVRRAGGGVEPDVLAFVAAAREAAGIVPRRVTEGEIVARVQTALANAGARLLSDDPRLRPSDIDVAAVAGLGLAGWRGGPMQASDQAGLLATRNLMRGFALREGGLWSPDPLWDDLIRNGRRFGDLNG